MRLSMPRPMLLIGSPPCTKFSILQKLLLAKGLAPEQRDKFDYELAKATKHINFCVKLYHRQRAQGRYYLHEHPLMATSWRLPSMQTIVCREDNYEAIAHMCAFGMTTRDPAHGELPAMKPTRFVTKSWALSEALDRKCSCVAQPGKPKHGLLVAGRAAAAAIYPDDLCDNICVAVRRQKEMDAEGEVGTLRMIRSQLNGFIAA